MRPLLAALVLALPVAFPAGAGPLAPPARPDVAAGVAPAQDRFLGGIFGGGKREELERQAAADAVRVQELEAEVRRLTGQVETLTYTVRRLEGALAASGTADPRLAGGAAVAGAVPGTGMPAGAPPAPLGATLPSGDLSAGDFSRGGDVAAAGTGGFDGPSSAPVDLSALNNGAALAPAEPQPARSAGGQRNAALAEVQELHDSGRYAMAAERARQILAQAPAGSVASEARYMLGEALLAQRDFRGAANSFLENYTADPQGTRAPMSLVRLGTALNGLGEKAAACSSLDELFGAYPNLDPAVRAEALREREAADCA